MQILLFQKQIPLRTCPKHFALDINRELIQSGFEMYRKRRKIIPVVHKSAPCLVPSAVPMTQQGRRKKPCHGKADDGSGMDRVLLLLLHTASLVPRQG